jgi:hypothetical protein
MKYEELRDKLAQLKRYEPETSYGGEGFSDVALMQEAPQGRYVDLVEVIGLVPALLLQAYEEAMRASCKFCEHNLPVERLAGGDWHHPQAWKVHTLQGKESHRADAACDANGIRKLADSLVQETIAST